MASMTRTAIVIISSITALLTLSSTYALQDHGDPEQTGHGAAASTEDHAGGGGGEAGHESAETQRAHAIAVQQMPGWYPYVIGGSAALFLAAIILGSAAIVMKTPTAHGQE